LAPLAQRVVALERENARRSHQRKQAETRITVPQKVSELWGIALEANTSGVGPSGRPARRGGFRVPVMTGLSDAESGHRHPQHTGDHPWP